VFEPILQHIQAKIRTLNYVMTIHADEEMDDDGLSILDIEQVILTGQIVERQRVTERAAIGNTLSMVRQMTAST
jgi:hypothetical protein